MLFFVSIYEHVKVEVDNKNIRGILVPGLLCETRKTSTYVLKRNMLKQMNKVFIWTVNILSIGGKIFAKIFNDSTMSVL